MALIEPKTTPVVANGVYPAMIQMVAHIVDGKLTYSCNASVRGAKVSNEGLANEAWVPTGETKAIRIPDIENLDADIAAAQDNVLIAFSAMREVIRVVNDVREVI